MNQEVLESGPFGHEKTSVSRTMLLVMLALLPTTLYGIYLFGWPALYLFLITLIAAVAFEAASLQFAGKPIRPFLMDGSALLTGWLLALSLPPWAPWWIAVLGAFLAIVIGKQVFGGIGQNLFNPAMVARVALLISFPLEMTTWVTPQPLFTSGSPGLLESLAITFGSSSYDAITSASLMGHVKTELGRGIELSQALGSDYQTLPMALGNIPGSLGETSGLLIILGGAFLLYKRIISWHIPLSMLVTLAVMATIFNSLHPERYADAYFHIFNGAALLGAFFIATDLVTSPVTAKGQIIFGAGCGALVYIIRTWAGYPEGVGFAILLMNALTPLIDHYVRPRIFGRDQKGAPIQYDLKGGSND